MSTVTYKCPNCDAGLVFSPEKQRFVCEFCISDFTEEELKAGGSDTRADQEERENTEFSSQINEYSCPSCGAEIIADVNTLADICCYCHNPIVISSRSSGTLRPSKIIPFKFDKAEAKESFLRFAKKKWFAPKDYASAQNAENITGIYYPFWVTDADTEANMDADATIVRHWRAGDYAYTETSRYGLVRGGDIHFEDITSCAISTEDKAMLEGILPYPSDCHIDFSMPYLQGFIAKKRDVDREALTDTVRDRMHSYAESLLRDTIVGYDTVTPKSTGIRINKSHWEYTLMPVWLLSYSHKGKKFTYAMNGYTGKVYGELPVSIPKLAALFGIVFGVALAIAMLLGYFAF